MTTNKGMMLTSLLLMAVLLAACSNNGQAADSTIEQEEHAEQKLQAYEERYQKAVFLGDSITEGLVYHEVLTEEQVIADAGKTAQFALETGNVDEVVARNPEHVYIQLGSTDILWPSDDPVADAMLSYAQMLDQMRERLPDARITVLAVTPVTEAAKEAEPRYERIEAYNERLRALAKEKQVEYIDPSALAAAHSALYEEDGVHFQAAFYPLLLDYMQASDGR